MNESTSNPGIQAASASWVSPLLTVACNVFANGAKVDPTTSRWISLGAGLFIVVGLVCAIFALAVIPKYGTRKILIPALIGLVLNLAWVALLVMAILVLANR